MISDGSAPTKWIASNLLAQAKHDEMAIPILVTNSTQFAEEVNREVSKKLKNLQERNIAVKAVRNCGRMFVVDTLQ
ncbi:MAG: hypothetical protein KatS3mg006_0083 [Pyrinomonadaceae bacterium]|nr:MAG: hypothetical protein KatS3mg006_0083 [Pyrinomonadaceae bacterium]